MGFMDVLKDIVGAMAGEAERRADSFARRHGDRMNTDQYKKFDHARGGLGDLRKWADNREDDE